MSSEHLLLKLSVTIQVVRFKVHGSRLAPYMPIVWLNVSSNFDWVLHFECSEFRVQSSRKKDSVLPLLPPEL